MSAPDPEAMKSEPVRDGHGRFGTNDNPDKKVNRNRGGRSGRAKPRAKRLPSLSTDAAPTVPMRAEESPLVAALSARPAPVATLRAGGAPVLLSQPVAAFGGGSGASRSDAFVPVERPLGDVSPLTSPRVRAR